MTKEEESQLNSFLVTEMVSTVSLAEAVNIMHKLAVEEVKANVAKMTDEEKESVLADLKEKLKASRKEKAEAEKA